MTDEQMAIQALETCAKNPTVARLTSMEGLSGLILHVLLQQQAALKFYANPTTWKGEHPAAMADHGGLARAALKVAKINPSDIPDDIIRDGRREAMDRYTEGWLPEDEA